MSWSRQQLDPGCGRRDTRHPTQQPPRAKDSITLGDSIQGTAAELQLLPPVPGAPGDHRSSHIPIGLSTLLKLRGLRLLLIDYVCFRYPLPACCPEHAYAANQTCPVRIGAILPSP